MVSSANNFIGLPTRNPWLERLNDAKSPVPDHPFAEMQKLSATTAPSGDSFTQRSKDDSQNHLDRFTRILTGTNQFAQDGGTNAITAEKAVSGPVTQVSNGQGFNSFAGLSNVDRFTQQGLQGQNNVQVMGTLANGLQGGQHTVNNALIGGLADQYSMSGTGNYNTSTLVSGAKHVMLDGQGNFNRFSAYADPQDSARPTGSAAVEQLLMAGKGNLHNVLTQGHVHSLQSVGDNNVSLTHLLGDVDEMIYNNQGTVTQDKHGEALYSSAHSIFTGQDVKQAHLGGDTNFYRLSSTGHIDKLQLMGSHNRGTIFNSSTDTRTTKVAFAGESNDWEYQGGPAAQHLMIRGKNNAINGITSFESFAGKAGVAANTNNDTVDLGGEGTHGTLNLGAGDDAVIVRQTHDDDSQPFDVTLYGGSGRNTLQLEGDDWKATPVDQAGQRYTRYDRGNQHIRAFDFQKAQGVPIDTHPPGDMAFLPRDFSVDSQLTPPTSPT